MGLVSDPIRIWRPQNGCMAVCYCYGLRDKTWGSIATKYEEPLNLYWLYLLGYLFHYISPPTAAVQWKGQMFMRNGPLHLTWSSTMERALDAASATHPLRLNAALLFNVAVTVRTLLVDRSGFLPWSTDTNYWWWCSELVRTITPTWSALPSLSL